MNEKEIAIYFHRDFDGMISAALIADYVRNKWSEAQLRLFPVGYSRKINWKEMPLRGDVSFVLDYIFHPQATYWFDHHQTGLNGYDGPLDPNRHFFNPKKTSCALLIWEVLYNTFNYRNLNFQNLVKWADKIDSAQFSLEELINCEEKALKIHLSLGIEADNAYLIELTRLFIQYKDQLLSSQIPLPLIVRWRFEKIQQMRPKITEEFKKRAIFDPQRKLVFFTMSQDFLSCRWAPYYFYPECLYVVGILSMRNGHYMIMVNANPWQKAKNSINIGKLCASYGGGGHPPVGAITVTTASQAQRIAEEIISFLKTKLSSDKD